MSPKKAAFLTLLLFLGLFTFQLLWTHGQLERLRSLGRRGLRRHAQQQHAAAHTVAMGAELDGLGLAGDDGGASGAADEAVVYGDGQSMPNPALIVFAFNRAHYLNQTLRSLLRLRGLQRYSVYVSQDGNDTSVADVVASLAPHFLRRARGFALWQKTPRVAALGPNQPGHAWLAQHYKWGLDRLFAEKHSHAVIVEDDMLFSPDFLLYFEATAPLLDADPTLWCVSSWNDNGFVTGHAWNASRLFRSSYFPGLGWMMKRELWEELGPKWPLDHWDHWMRDDEVARGRDCICPEVNRNKNIGEVGANMNKQAFKRYLKTMGWNENQTVTDWGDLDRLTHRNYAADMRHALATAQPWDALGGRRAGTKPQAGATYYVYYTIEQYTRLALRMKLWPYPRAHFRHIASIPWMGASFLLADRRFCPLIPEAQQLTPTPGLLVVSGKQHQSCTDACAEQGLLCSRTDFWWLNSCSVLRKHFPCEHGCTVELGPDVPAYVAAAGQTLHKYCLITQKASTCVAKHAATARLCPCLPIEGEEVQRRLLALPDGSGRRSARSVLAQPVGQQRQLGSRVGRRGSGSSTTTAL